MLAAEYSAVQPGIFALVVVVVALAFAVWVAKRERDRRDRIGADLPAGAWTAPCLDVGTTGTKRVLILTDDALAIAETSSGSRDSWPWAEVRSVEEKQLRARLQSYPGIRITFADGHARELLVYIGDGKASYRAGALESHARITRHLSRPSPAE